ncbi:hypothetical protein D3C80_1543520 [compost metagenome]
MQYRIYFVIERIFPEIYYFIYFFEVLKHRFSMCIVGVQVVFAFAQDNLSCGLLCRMEAGHQRSQGE